MKKALTLLCTLGFLGGLSSAADKPNIIFLLADDLAANAVGYNGNKDVITPNIDKLAHDGVRFMNHYDTSSICMASRCTMLTGLYEYRHGCNFSHGDLERRFIEKSYPVLLRKAGYFTGFAGKIGFVLQDEKFEALGPLFDEWAGGPGQTYYETAKNEGIAKYADRYPHCSRAYGAWALDFLKSAKSSGKPFCLSISFKAPHMPHTPDPIDMKLYEGKTFTRPPNYGVAKGEHLSPQVHTSRAATGYREWVTDFDDTVAKYYALITGVDAAVGMIREGLAQEGLDKNTVIILTSDNGYNAGSHGFGDKVIPYEEGSKAPLIIYDPRLPAESNGKACQALTGNIDMAPTIFALAGEPAPAMDGKNLLSLLSNPADKVRDFLPLFNFWGTASAQSMAIATPEWKYIHWYYGEGMKPTEELFHLATDSIEMTNLITDPKYAATLAAMRSHYDTELAAIAPNLAPGHDYENYPTLFSRTIPWEQKAALKGAKKEKRKRRRNGRTSNDPPAAGHPLKNPVRFVGLMRDTSSRMNIAETHAAQVFLAHHDFVKGVALKYAPWPGLMEDITQQVFLEFMAKESKWDLSSDARPLLATMTRHIAMRLWRERTRQQPDVVQKLADHIRLLAEERETPPRYEDEVRVLRTCLQKLPQKSRELVELYYYDDVGTPQIAEQIQMKADTVCRALSRVREKLRECIEQNMNQGGHAHA